MTQLPPSQFESLLVTPRRWVDVRAPVEFFEGSVPGAINLPLLTDDERHQIGLTYKQNGQQAAIALGHQLVSGETKDARVRSWQNAVAADPNAVIFCFRGGLRSQITQTWLQEQGVERPIVNGGYKALRRLFLEIIEERIDTVKFEVVSGLTGSGKTAFLRTSGRPFLDLEDLAAHRGSAFGATERPQPSQANFENELAVKLLRLIHGEQQPFLIEREGRAIGKCVLPPKLFAKLLVSPQIQIEVSFEQRVENVLADYVIAPFQKSLNADLLFGNLTHAVKAISRKLGGARAQEVLQDLAHSRCEFEAGHGLDSNRIWIGKLLLWYYDPMYTFALNRK